MLVAVLVSVAALLYRAFTKLVVPELAPLTVTPEALATFTVPAPLCTNAMTVPTGNATDELLGTVIVQPDELVKLRSRLASARTRVYVVPVRDPISTAVLGAGPVGPVGPVFPVGPVGPVAPVLPVGPVGPVLPVLPVGPVGPVGPVPPVFPVGPVGPTPPVLPVGPVGPTGPVGPVTP